MKPEIKAMLPELPENYEAKKFDPDIKVVSFLMFDAWLDKLTKGAQVVTGFGGSCSGWSDIRDNADTHTALLICAREIEQAVPLSEVIMRLREFAASKDDILLADRLEKFGVK